MSLVGPLNPPRNFYEVWSLIRGLGTSLLKLTFSENFDSFQQEVTIPANSELAIRNLFRSRIPTGFVITDHTGGIVRRGTTAWSNDYVYLENVSSTSPAVIKVNFLA